MCHHTPPPLSPHATVSNPNPQRADIVPWPPKSPAEVLLLTPKKQLPGNLPISPSPLRTANRPALPPSPLFRRRPADFDDPMDDDLFIGSSDEDEETLQLKLARIEAKLKLKQLQRKRKRTDSVTEGSNVEGGRRPSVTASLVVGPVSKLELPTAIETMGASIGAISQGQPQSKDEATSTEPTRSWRTRASTPVAQIQIAASPQKPPPPSPSRVLLGLDRGLRGKDISLKRAPNFRAGPPIAGVLRPTTGVLSTTDPADPFGSRPIPNGSIRNPSPERKTFNQRIAEARAADKEKKAMLAAIEKSRSKGFGLSEEEVAATAATAQAAQISSLETKSSSVVSLGPSKPSIWTTTDTSTTAVSTSHPTTSEPLSTSSSATVANTTGTGFDSFSQLHLSHRHMPHTTLSRALSQKTIFLLPDLLKTVISPNYEPPSIEGDWVVMGVIASKSEPRQTTKSTSSIKTNSGAISGGDKYMVMTLTDLKWDVELFFFGTGFNRFWKLTVGAVVAILNPGVMRPRQADSGRFSLTVSSSEETILEIGYARDLGFCKSVKRDGKLCGMWVDKRRMEHCSFHIELALKKTANSRMELNNVGKLFAPPDKRARPGFLTRAEAGMGGRRTLGASSTASRGDEGLLPEGPLPDLPQRLGGAGGKVYIYPSHTDALFDDSYADAFHNGTREERMCKQLAKGQRERDIAKRLVAAQRKIGGGAHLSTGAEYLKKVVEKEELKKAKEAETAKTRGSSGNERERVREGEGEGKRTPNGMTETSQSLRTTTPTIEAAAAPMPTTDFTSLLSHNRRTSSVNVQLSPLRRRKKLAVPTPTPHVVLVSTSTSTAAALPTPFTSTSISTSTSTSTPTSTPNPIPTPAATATATTTTAAIPIPIPIIQRQRPVPRPLPTPPPLKRENSSGPPLKKKAKTVHFRRPVVTGGGVIPVDEDGHGDGDGDGDEHGQEDDDDDDLEIC